MMAKVVMEIYDPQFAARTKAGDVIVSQFNFGTGSSREQAVTCLKAKGIPLVIAGQLLADLSRNGVQQRFFVYRRCRTFVMRVREQFWEGDFGEGEDDYSGRRIDIDFTLVRSCGRREVWRSQGWAAVPQSLVIAGGVENLVAKRRAFCEGITAAIAECAGGMMAGSP